LSTSWGTDPAGSERAGPAAEASVVNELDDVPSPTDHQKTCAQSDPSGVRPRLRWLVWVGIAAGSLQAVILIVYSAHLYSHFDLTLDFAVENQAWSRIAHGDLNPYMTINPHNYPHYGYPYWQDHLELITWPMALLALVFPSSLTLLVIQDLALAGCTAVIALFARDVLVANPAGGGNESGPAHMRPSRWERKWDRGWLPALGLGAIFIALVNPWTYWSASFDFHIQALATLFALLVARDLWNGRFMRSLWWMAALLLCGNVAGTYLVGIGVFALLSIHRRDLRKPGIAIAAGGIVASVLFSAVGGAEGTLIGYNYAYLAHVTPGTSAGTGAIVAGILTHPETPLHMIWSRVHILYLQLASAGLIGVLSPLGFGMSVVVLLENALNGSPVFSSQISAFQSLSVYAFVTVGTIMVLSWLGRIRWSGRRIVASVVALAILVQVVAIAAIWIPRASTQFAVVDGSTAAALSELQSKIPNGAEVVVSQGVIGRFADRRLVFPFLDVNNGGQVVPVYGRGPVVVVLTDAGVEFATTAGTSSAVAYLRSIGAQEITSKNGVHAFLLHPATGMTHLMFPATSG
jgi:uncharacterized membrane protein